MRWYQKIMRGWKEEMDKIVKVNKSLIQHGKHSDRVYLMKLAISDYPEIIYQLKNIALSQGYTKIVAKVPEYAYEGFIQQGFESEATIQRTDNGGKIYFMSKFMNKKRLTPLQNRVVKDVLKKSKNVSENLKIHPLTNDYHLTEMTAVDIPKMAELYRSVFKTYPFPIFDEDYLESTMDSHVRYFGIWHNHKLVALASAEIDTLNHIVEMTDFATLKPYQGNGFATHLLTHMEEIMMLSQYSTLYTIARSLSFGMNITFAKLGYKYTGTLVNNTNISGGLESMNVWAKQL